MHIAARVRSAPLWAQDLLTGLLALAAGWAIWQLAGLTDWNPRGPITLRMSILATAVVLATRRLWPRATFWVTMAAFPLLYDAPVGIELSLLPLAIAGYGACRSGRLHPALAMPVAGLATLATYLRGSMAGQWVATGYWRPSHGLGELAELMVPADFSKVGLCLVMVESVTVLGWVMWRLASQRAELQRRGERLAAQNAELEQLRQREARDAVIRERQRIARDLHDIIAHHVAAIVVRAGAAARVGHSNPAAAIDATEWIATAGREALAQMRATVAVLNDDRQVAYAPGGDLSALAGAIATARASGLDVNATLPDPLPTLRPAAAQAVVRIVQESLANVLLHSGATSATVRVDASAWGVRVRVSDPGPPGGTGQLGGPTAPLGSPPVVSPVVPGPGGAAVHLQQEPRGGVGGGNGLRNMAERARVAGGHLHAGPLEHGWEVDAWVPLASQS